MIQSVFGHRDVVSCVDFSPEEGLCGCSGNGIVASGSHDATVLLWRWSGKKNRIIGTLAETQGLLTTYQ